MDVARLHGCVNGRKRVINFPTCRVMAIEFLALHAWRMRFLACSKFKSRYFARARKRKAEINVRKEREEGIKSVFLKGR